MSYADFLGVVASGRKNVSASQQNVMPLRDNPNVAATWTTSTSHLRAAPMTRRGGAARENTKTSLPPPSRRGFLHGQAMIIGMC